jgi:hypothetical protein
MTDTHAARIIAALVGDSLAALQFTTEDYDEGAWKCGYCHESGHSAPDVNHAPDCPILAARAWLAAQQAGAGDGG